MKSVKNMNEFLMVFVPKNVLIKIVFSMVFAANFFCGTL